MNFPFQILVSAIMAAAAIAFLPLGKAIFVCCVEAVTLVFLWVKVFR